MLQSTYQYANIIGTVDIRILVILCRIRIFVCIRILVYFKKGISSYNRQYP
jgi:hypothetical protein